MSANQSLQIEGALINNGNVLLGATSELTLLSSYKGNNRIQGAGTITFRSELELDDEPALLSIEGSLKFSENSLVQLKTNGSTQGETYDAINVSSTITLAGTLHIQTSQTLTLKHGDVLTLLQGNQIVGEFDTVELPNLQDKGLELSVNQSASKLEIQVTQYGGSDDNAEQETKGGSLGLYSILLLLIVVRNTVNVVSTTLA